MAVPTRNNHGYETDAIWLNECPFTDAVTTTPPAGTTAAPDNNGTYQITDTNAVPCLGIGVRIKAGSGGGALEVHLVNSPAGRWTVYDSLAAADKEYFIFDAVRTNNTTLTASDVLVLLGEFV